MTLTYTGTRKMIPKSLFHDMMIEKHAVVKEVDLSMVTAAAVNVTPEMTGLDISQVMLMAYELGDMINHSREAAEYLHWKKVVESSADIQEVVRLLARKKEAFADCERFGHFHPDYHRALDEVKEVEQQLDQFEAVRQYKKAEQELDDLLYEMSRTIAHAVSESIKVPSNNPLPVQGGCGSGGPCRCG